MESDSQRGLSRTTPRLPHGHLKDGTSILPVETTGNPRSMRSGPQLDSRVVFEYLDIGEVDQVAKAQSLGLGQYPLNGLQNG